MALAVLIAVYSIAGGKYRLAHRITTLTSLVDESLFESSSFERNEIR